MNQLGAAALKSAPVCKHADSAGLWLFKGQDCGAQQVLRVTPHCSRREMKLRFKQVHQIKGGLWTIPAPAMKCHLGAIGSFGVPLPTEPQAAVPEVRKLAGDGLLFPSVKRGVKSDTNMTVSMDWRGPVERQHGLCSPFRDRAAEATNTPTDFAETCLVYTTGKEVEPAYRRTDFLDQRQTFMGRWGEQVEERNSQVLKVDF